MDDTINTFVCERCHHVSSCKGNLIKHLTKKSQCDTLHSNVSREELVKILTRVSTKEKTFQCNFCTKTFSTIQGKSQHKKVCPMHPELKDKRRIKELETQIQTLQKSQEELQNQLEESNRRLLDLLQANTPSNGASTSGTQEDATDNNDVVQDAGVAVNNDKGKHTKKKISKQTRVRCWNTYIGEDVGRAKCICCQSTMITTFTFECGHVVAQSQGGGNELSNLRPICRECNGSMGTQNMKEYAKEEFGVDIE
jgi:hypothetical protein